MRRKRVFKEAEKEGEEWVIDDEARNLVVGDCHIDIPEAYPLTPPKLRNSNSLAKNAMGREGIWKEICVLARRETNSAFFPLSCPCCVNPACSWSPARKLAEMVNYKRFLQDCADFVEKAPDFSYCRLSLLPNDVLKEIIVLLIK